MTTARRPGAGSWPPWPSSPTRPRPGGSTSDQTLTFAADAMPFSSVFDERTSHHSGACRMAPVRGIADLPGLAPERPTSTHSGHSSPASYRSSLTTSTALSLCAGGRARGPICAEGEPKTGEVQAKKKGPSHNGPAKFDQTTSYGRIISLSSCSSIWQCQTKRPV
jgi:hypothetical protein